MTIETPRTKVRGVFFMLDVGGNKIANGYQFDDCVKFKMVVR